MAAVSYIHKVHPRARSLKLKIESNGQVVVVTPRFVPKFAIDLFVKQHQTWIDRTLAKLGEIKKSPVTDTSIEIFGKTYNLNVAYSHQKPIGITIVGDSLELNPVTLNPTSTKIKSHLERFLKQTAEKYLVPRTHQLAKIMDTTFSSITLRQQKTRWGSCSSRGALNFNWRLVHYSPPIIDYVIIHELAHRTHMDHSSAFWNLVKKYDSDYLKHRGWLKRHGLSLG